MISAACTGSAVSRARTTVAGVSRGLGKSHIRDGVSGGRARVARDRRWGPICRRAARQCHLPERELLRALAYWRWPTLLIENGVITTVPELDERLAAARDGRLDQIPRSPPPLCGAAAGAPLAGLRRIALHRCGTPIATRNSRPETRSARSGVARVATRDSLVTPVVAEVRSSTTAAHTCFPTRTRTDSVSARSTCIPCGSRWRSSGVTRQTVPDMYISISGRATWRVRTGDPSRVSTRRRWPRDPEPCARVTLVREGATRPGCRRCRDRELRTSFTDHSTAPE